MTEGPHPLIHAAIYARVSTDDQSKGFSIPTQIERCRAYAQAQQILVREPHICIDQGWSGATLKRPGLRAIRALVEQQAIQVVLVYDLDRLSRKVGHVLFLKERWEQLGVTLQTVAHPIDASSEGDLLMAVQGAVAEYERAKILERSARGTQKRLESGLPHGRWAPYGYHWTKIPHASTLEIDEAEATIVRQVFRWAAEGWPIRAIARQLTREQRPSRADSFDRSPKTLPKCAWSPASIFGMLHYEGYIGRAYGHQSTMVAGKRTLRPREEWIETPMPAILDERTFQAVAKQLEKNKADATRNRKYEYLFSTRTLRCGRCGRGMVGFSAPSRRPGKRWVRYRCNTLNSRSDGTHCKGILRGSLVEPHVWAVVEQLLSHPEMVLQAVSLAHQGSHQQRASVIRQIEGLDQALIRLGQADTRLLEAYEGGALTVEELKARRETLSTQRQALLEEHWQAQEALAQLGAPPPELDALEDHLHRIRENLQRLSLADKRLALESLNVVVRWTPGLPLEMTAAVPSALPEALCPFHVPQIDAIFLTSYL